MALTLLNTLVLGTQMHIVTFIFICIEVVILSYLIIYGLARPDDQTSSLNCILIILLIIYNLTGGLLPDPNWPGSYFVQQSLAYGTGFITPCYFPYYVYNAFGLEKMRFHAYRGVLYFLVIPYSLFVLVLAITDNVEAAKKVLFLPVLYALWVLRSVWKAVRYKYHYSFENKKSREELIILFTSLSPWMALPLISYFDLSQAVEATTTNTGFLLLLALHLKRNVQQIREEHHRLMESELYLRNWNEQLQREVEKRTREMERMRAEERLLQNGRSFHLTNREQEIARFIYSGCTYKQIAETLFISERTVAKHVQNIFEKVEVSNKMELCKKLGI